MCRNGAVELKGIATAQCTYLFKHAQITEWRTKSIVRQKQMTKSNFETNTTNEKTKNLSECHWIEMNSTKVKRRNTPEFEYSNETKKTIIEIPIGSIKKKLREKNEWKKQYLRFKKQDVIAK